jgi:L-threonylcarbamoyladenylate synthase
MSTVHLFLEHSAQEALASCVDALRQPGGVILVPTETVYGLACRWADAAARERIRGMKGREAEKPMQMLAPDLAAALAAGVTDAPAVRRLVERFCPGPLTLVQHADIGGTIGFRIPDHPFVLALLRDLREPLAATSANRSGEPPAIAFAEALAHLSSSPDVAVDGGIVAASALASTVVDLSVAPWRILREGPIRADQLRAVLDR